ncbi:MAG: ABC transporter permease [Thermodesulfobacteriota bacterium]
MRIYLLKRLALAVLTLFFLASILFILFRMLPGDPTITVLSTALDPEVQQEMRHRFGLDRPMIEQYFLYLKNLSRGEFGVSFQHGVRAYDIVADKFWNTIVLMLPAFILAFLSGIILGSYVGWKRGSRLEKTVVMAALFFRSAPDFWMAMVFIFVFSVKLDLFPAGHMRTPGYAAGGRLDTFLSLDFLYHLALPLIMMSLYYSCYPLLVMRTAMLEVMGEDFIELCQAKGLSERRVIFKHAMRNSLLPIATSVSLLGAYASAGSVLIETVFSWPGLGRLMVQSVIYSDYPVAQASFLIIGVFVVSGNLLSDILYGVLDPRIRYR